MADGQRLLVVVGEGTVAVTPDRCVLTFAVNVTRAGVAEAVSEVTTLAEQVVTMLRAAKVEAAHVRTHAVSVQESFDHQAQKVTGHTAMYTLSVSDRQLDQVGPLIASLTEVAGDALRVQGIALTISDPAPHLEAARHRAIEDGIAKAQQLVSAAHLRLGEIRTIEEGGGVVPLPRPYNVARLATEALALPIEAGSETVQARVTITFAIEG